MKTVLLPVKDFRNAKKRLAGALDSVSRCDLARAMYCDVLDALSRAKTPDRVVVFTASNEAAGIARDYGFDVIIEASVTGHSDAVNLMVSELLPASSQILSIAGDLPKLQPEEVDFVMTRTSEPIVVLRSQDGTGTNGVLFIPPSRITMEFGENSFFRHMSSAARAGIRAGALDVPGIAFDVDTPEDLEAFLADPRRDGQTWQCLMSRK